MDLTNYVESKRISIRARDPPPTEDPTFFNFSEIFLKLNQEIMTTLRSLKHQGTQFFNGKYEKIDIKVGMIGWAELRKKRLFRVKIISFEDRAIGDFPLDILKRDIDSVHITVNSYIEVIQELNRITMNAGFSGYNRLTTIKRLFTFQRVY